jgi:hypothetical protein
MTKVLINITSYREYELKYLKPVLDSYTGKDFKDFEVTVVLSTAYDYKPVNCINLPQTYTGWEHTFNGNEFLKEHYQEHDLIISQDSDILVTPQNIQYYLKYQSLPVEYIGGFLVAEGKYLISMKQPHFPFVTEKLVIEGKQWIVPHILHQASSISDRDRYGKYLQTASKGVLKASKGYSVGALARTEIYLSGGMKKVVSIDGIKDGSAIIQHIPMKYINGTPKFELWKFMTPEKVLKEYSHDFPR